MSFFYSYKIVNKSDYIDYSVINEPSVNIVNINDTPFLVDFFTKAKKGDECFINYTENDLNHFLLKLYQMNDHYNQFVVDNIRCSLYYNKILYKQRDDVINLYTIIHNTYPTDIAHKIICFCTQGALAFIVCSIQNIVRKKNDDIFVCELTNNNKLSKKISTSICCYRDNVTIDIIKPLRLVLISCISMEELCVFTLNISYIVSLADGSVNKNTTIEIIS